MFVQHECHHHFFPKHQNSPSPIEFHFRPFWSEKDEIDEKKYKPPFLQSMVQALLTNHTLFKFYHLDMSTSSKFMMLCMASSLFLNLLKMRYLHAKWARFMLLVLWFLRLSFIISVYYLIMWDDGRGQSSSTNAITLQQTSEVALCWLFC